MRYPALVAATASALSFGCSTAPSVPAPERQPPVLCLSSPRTPVGCTLADHFDRLALADQLADLLRCHEQEVRAAAERQVMLLDCRDYLLAEP